MHVFPKEAQGDSFDACRFTLYMFWTPSAREHMELQDGFVYRNKHGVYVHHQNMHLQMVELCVDLFCSAVL